MTSPVRIGTRGSRLALWQAQYVADALHQGGVDSRIVVIETKGDQVLDVAISKIGSKGVFTQELEDQLREGTIDVAVHSAKDMPSQLPDDLELIAFSRREQANDVLVSHTPGLHLGRPGPLVVGTSSTRRRALVRRFYPQVSLVDMRGNLQTRLRKLGEGQCDALLLAYAGVHRMGYEAMVTQVLPLDEFTPAVGQGSVAVEASVTLTPQLRAQLRACVNHPATEVCLLSERAFLRQMQGGCSVPVFGLATWRDPQTLTLTGGIVGLDGQTYLRETDTAPPEEAAALGNRVAQRLLARGGGQLLLEIRAALAG